MGFAIWDYWNFGIIGFFGREDGGIRSQATYTVDK